MHCIKCGHDKTKCIDDMILERYWAEIFKCTTCNGSIEVEYNNPRLSRKTIKSYVYREEKQ